MLRTLLALAFAIATSSLNAQESSSQDLPPANQKMLEFAHMKMGQKVGNGICASFVSAAQEYTNGKAYWGSGRKLDLRRELIKPGDVLYMRWYKRKRGKATQSHVAIIIEVMEPHLVKVAHQNFNNQKFVVETIYDLNQKIRDGRRVVIYRPEGKASAQEQLVSTSH